MYISILIKKTITLTLTFLISAVVFAGSHHDRKGLFTSTTVTENILMLQGKGGNLALLKGQQGLLLVDADYQEMSSALHDELTHHGGAEKVVYVINTHWHGDHTGGNNFLGDYSVIVAHDNVRSRLLSTQEIKLFGTVTQPYPVKAVPSITYKNSLSLYINDEEVNIIHFPNGHTDGDSIVFFKDSNVVHMGDHFFSGFFPFVDVENGGNVLTMAKNVNAVLSMIDSDTKIIPGHGPLSKKSDLIRFYNMLVGVSAEIKAMKESGLSIDKIKEKGLSEKWESWGHGFLPTETWIGIVYDSLNK